MCVCPHILLELVAHATVALIKCPADRSRFEIRQAHIALRLSGSLVLWLLCCADAAAAATAAAAVAKVTRILFNAHTTRVPRAN